MRYAHRESYAPEAKRVVERMFDGRERWYYSLSEYAARKFEGELKFRIFEIFGERALLLMCECGGHWSAKFHCGMDNHDFLTELGRLLAVPQNKSAQKIRYKDVKPVEMYAKIRRLNSDEMFALATIVSAAHYNKDKIKDLSYAQRGHRTIYQTPSGKKAGGKERRNLRAMLTPWLKWVVGATGRSDHGSKEQVMCGQ